MHTNCLQTDLNHLFQQAVSPLGIVSEGALIVESQRPDLGHYQCNVALPAAKQLQKPPRVIAQTIVDTVLAMNSDMIAELTLAGPGFINVIVADAYLADLMSAMVTDERAGCLLTNEPRKVVIDFGGPNVAKPMHVGHLRSSIIGDALQRMATFLGHETVSDIHLGDWGTQMGMVISEIQRRQPDLPYFADDVLSEYPAAPPVTLSDLEDIYPTVSALCKSDEQAMGVARQVTAELQAGQPGYYALWKHLVQLSIDGLKKDFQRLGVSFDYWLGESDAQAHIPELIDLLKTTGHLVESEGAQVVEVVKEDDTKEIPPLIVLKSDGGVMYGTTDLATILQRMNAFTPDDILYVVDARQGLHFEQVFRAAVKSGITSTTGLEHIGFGTINGKDGKPFKTRAGGVMKLGDLLTMATDSARDQMKGSGVAADLNESERETVAVQIGLAAVKFADLSNHRLSSYIFDLDRFTRFEGKTGPYLQYAVVRIKSVLNNAEQAGLDLQAANTIHEIGERERALVLMLSKFNKAVEGAYEQRAPNILCEYLFELAQKFSAFYQHCHILKEQDKARQNSWLSLVILCKHQLETGLELLGIEVPSKM